MHLAMGWNMAARTFSSAERRRYRLKMRRCLDALALMLDQRSFSFPQRQMGMEVELNLVDGRLRPAMANSLVLEKISDPRFTTELGQQNLELNVPPCALVDDHVLDLEKELAESLEMARGKAFDSGVALVLIGMLPTLRAEHFDAKWLSPGDRYTTLNDEIFAARGEDMLVDIDGAALPGAEPERLTMHIPSILAESACTSMQLHLQVSPDDFGAYWNAAQALAGVQVALGANSPFLLNKALWHETRIPLFQQATDTRPEELRNQGVRPRVWFGERWIDSIFDLFEENVRYFPGLLPETDDEDPLQALSEDRAPKLTELRKHNGTVWRWNRPVYDVVDGVPHLRVENRVLPAGPTVLDMMANAAFFFGAQRVLATEPAPVWTEMSFAAAEENLRAAARDGLGARLYWPGVGWVTPDELVLRKLLPAAHEGLRQLGMSDQTRERYLSVVEQRCVTRRTGSVWQRGMVTTLESRGADRESALLGMLRRYIDHCRSGDPVHTWPTE
jgi:gamma-glutamyl:cysteine ligase YbdK (ATP-grasp superfamily)